MKMDPNHFMWWFSEIDRNRVTVLVNDVEELTNELSEATKKIRKATLAVENAETNKARLDASVELKKATARLEAVNYLKVFYYFKI
jgi:F0F1-type ATP synthase epsilon subunit